MLHTLSVSSDNHTPFNLPQFLKYLDIPITQEFEGTEGNATFYYLQRPDHSTTFFLLVDCGEGTYEIGMDGMASFADYKFFPYLADSLHRYLTDTPLLIDNQSMFERYNEEWIAEAIGEEIATLKSVLSIAPRYYLTLPFQLLSYLSKEMLAEVATGLHSSTPRIYGYSQFLMRNHRLKQATDEEFAADQKLSEQEIMVDVPQHTSIGKVKSWQLDGAETWESYAEEDIKRLLALGELYKQGKPVDGVVLNDLGTIYQEGIGVKQDGHLAEYWFRQAIAQGDHHYAPSNLGDLYRKGCAMLPASLPQALQAYLLSEDPYAHYRIGQAYEEGWTGTSDIKKAMKWYRIAEKEGHHLAVKRLQKDL